MLYTFNEPDAPERHDLQYFEMFANRGIYHKGWSAVTKHRTPWVMVGGELPAFDDDVWELYDGNTRLQPGPRPGRRAPRDAGQAAAALADRGDEVQRAADRRPQRRSGSSPTMAGRPTLIRGQLAAVLPRHGTALGEQRGQHQEQVVLGHRRGRGPRGRRRRRDHRPGRPVRRLGVLRQGRAGSSSSTTCSASSEFATEADEPDPGRHPPGADGVRLRRRRAGQGRRRHPVLRRQRRSARGRVEATQPMVFSADETTDIGYESGTTVSRRLHRRTPAGSPARSTGSRSTLGDDDHDHFIDPEERLRVAMARQYGCAWRGHGADDAAEARGGWWRCRRSGLPRRRAVAQAVVGRAQV